MHRYRTLASARPRAAHLRGFFGDGPADAMTPDAVRRFSGIVEAEATPAPPRGANQRVLVSGAPYVALAFLLFG